MLCPSCSRFINLDFLVGNDSFVEDDQGDVGAVLCDCGTHLCPNCETADHPGLWYTQNKAIHAGSDEPLLQIASQKAISESSILNEFTHGCNHMRCTNCHHDVCYLCLCQWNFARGLCSAGACEFWNKLLKSCSSKRTIHGVAFAQQDRRLHVDPWDTSFATTNRTGSIGECERRGLDLYAYFMVCEGEYLRLPQAVAGVN